MARCGSRIHRRAAPAAGAQMTAGTSQLAAQMEAFIAETQRSKGNTITVLKQARCGVECRLL